ncbi:hypothetical protein [Halococcus saccharolyticus]|uniref:hypothetical protein n=1 Tax=Halococcus saccharolyticus TaxID=62319 RepID=UPI000A729559|nr:hypothetical protein [Halococcus saccharolyticus]
MGLITGVIRLAWFLTVGWLLGSAYFLLMLLLSPFGTLSSGRVLNNTQSIMFLKTDG